MKFNKMLFMRQINKITYLNKWKVKLKTVLAISQIVNRIHQ